MSEGVLWSLTGEIWTNPGKDAPEWKRAVYAEFDDEVREFTALAAEHEDRMRAEMRRVASLPRYPAQPVVEGLFGLSEMKDQEQRFSEEWERLYSRFQHALEQAEAAAREADDATEVP